MCLIHGKKVWHDGKEIEKARDAVCSINSNMKSDITVYLRGGVYPITETLELKPSDSGMNGYRVKYQNYPGETPVLSGGTQITDFSLFDEQKNIYQAKVKPGSRFRQLYVDGKKRFGPGSLI